MLTADFNWKMFINTSLPDSGGLFLMKFFRNTYYLFIALLQHKQVIIFIIYVVYIQFNESPTPTSPTILPEAPQNGFLNQHLMQVKMGMIVLLHIERCSLKLVFHCTLPVSVWILTLFKRNNHAQKLRTHKGDHIVHSPEF